MDILEQAGQVAADRFKAAERPYRFKLIRPGGRAICCRLCGRPDRWQKENALVWVCEHTPPPLFPIRYLDSVKHAEVGLCVRQPR